MATTTLTRFKGGKELQDMLNTLPAKLERNIMRSALRAGAAVIRDAAREKIDDDTGELAKSVRVSTRAKRGEVSATVKAGNKKAFYAHMVEFGTAPHLVEVRDEDRPTRKTRKGEKSVSIGTMNRMIKRGSLQIGENFVGPAVMHPGAKPKPFMRPAIDEKQSEAIRAVGEQIRKRLTKEGLNAPGGLEVDDE